MTVREQIFELRDSEYGKFQAKLIPTVDADRIIGVRTQELRKLACHLRSVGGYEDFLRDLPHYYFDELQLHAFIISEEKDFDTALEETERLLPYVDNWATCDQLSPKVFEKHKAELHKAVERWLKSPEPYTARFGVGMLMQYFLDDDFSADDLAAVCRIKTDEYYVNMMRAWFFATALFKHHDEARRVLDENQLDPWTHNMTIRKACESFRIPDSVKEYLRKIKR